MTRLATLRRGFPTFTAPFRWIGRSLRRIWAASLLAMAMVVGPPMWWATQLIGLPDIGAPFDEAEFRAQRIPDESNAYRLYDQAWARYQGLDKFYKPTVNTQIDLAVRWPAAAPETRQWALANREVLWLYRKAAEMPDAMGSAPEFGTFHREVAQEAFQLFLFQQLALLEGSRLEASGDMAGAWAWYRANLRTIHLASRHATVERRVSAQNWHRTLNKRVAEWASDRRTTPELIRRAIDDVVACEALAPSEAYTLKADYLDVDRLLIDPKGPIEQPPRLTPINVTADLQLSPDYALDLYKAQRFLLREPERSRRVLRLAFANWLAYYDLPASARPQPDVDPAVDGVVDLFYPPTAQAPADARRMSPRDLTRWLATCMDANSLLGFWPLLAVRRNERFNHRDLVILLASELYRRDRRAEPPDDQALVGPYLKRLPPDFLEPRDSAVPVFGATRE
jgi:hypothetical protein